MIVNVSEKSKTTKETSDNLKVNFGAKIGNQLQSIFTLSQQYFHAHTKIVLFILTCVMVIAASTTIILQAKYKTNALPMQQKHKEKTIPISSPSVTQKTPSITAPFSPKLTTNPTPPKNNVTTTPTSSSKQRIPNPPNVSISWPTEGETITSDNFCFVDAPTGGDQAGVQERRNVNNQGWESYAPVYPSHSTCYSPSDGANTLSVQLKNQYGEEGNVYTRNFIYHKQVPTPTPASDTTPPTISQLDGPANGDTITTDTFCFTAHVTDNVSQTPNLWIRYKFEGGDWNAWTNNFNNCFSSRGENASFSFSIQAKDEAGNESSPITRNFTVNSQ